MTRDNPATTELKMSDISIALSSILQKFVSKLVGNDLSRHCLGIGFSIFLHLAVLGAYLALSALDQPEVLEIREITFMDEVYEPEPMQIRPEKSTPENRDRMEENHISGSPGMVAENVISENVSSERISLGERLDMPRKQAPINLAKTSPVALAKTNSDILKISPARGTKLDNRVANPGAPLSLESKGDLALSNHNSATPLNLDKTTDPYVTLARTEIGAAPIISGQKTAAADKPEKSSNPTLFGPRETSTYITGQLASRKIVQRLVPEFPLWAKRQGVGASISLSFAVMENGQVKENVVVVRTSGSRQWDKAVIEALNKWRFEPLSINGRQDQTGIITFQFVIE